MEEVARKLYINHQSENGHPGLFVAPCGFFIHPGSVYDPSSKELYGFLEIKCAFKYQDMAPREAARKSDFWCSLAADDKLKLKGNHVYYSQVLGQMAIGDRPWCDFCTYTKVGIYVERISFNKNTWETDILPKLISFYDNCVAPEIISPKHTQALSFVT